MKAAFKMFLLIFLVCTTLISFFSCGKKDRPAGEDPTASTEPDTDKTGKTDAATEKYQSDHLDPSLNFGNREVNFFGWNSGYNSDFYTEMDTGDAISDSVYYRNKRVEDRLHVSLNAKLIDGSYETQAEFCAAAMNEILGGGEKPCDLIACYSMCAGTLATRGVLKNLMAVEHLETEMPWWSASLIEGSKINNELYFITGDLANTFIYNLYFLAVNRTLLDGLHLEDPRELVLDGSWTWDEFFSMTKNVYRDKDETPGASEGDQYGYLVYGGVHYDCWLASTGIRMAQGGDDGIFRLTSDFTGEKTDALIRKMNSFLWGSDDFRADYDNGYATVRDGLTLFSSVAGSTVQPLKAAELNYNVLPYPKADAAQADYYTNLGFAYTNFCIPVSASDPDVCGAVLECMASEAYRTSAPLFFETNIKSKWATDEIDSKMYDIIKGSVYIDINRAFSSSFEWSRSSVALFRNALAGNKENWPGIIGAETGYINGILENISKSVVSQ